MKNGDVSESNQVDQIRSLVTLDFANLNIKWLTYWFSYYSARVNWLDGFILNLQWPFVQSSALYAQLRFLSVSHESAILDSLLTLGSCARDQIKNT